MKMIKIKILSVLLFAFTFFIFHDYVMDNLDADTQCELCYANQSKVVLDLPSQIHNYIHMLLDIPNLEIFLHPLVLITDVTII